MANELKSVFIDYASKLQSYLDQLAPNVFIVKAGKNLNVKIQDKVQVLVSYLQGGSNKDSVSLPIMLKIYSCAELQETVVGTFIQLSKLKAQSFYNEMVEVAPDELEEATVFEQITTPAVMQEDVSFGTNNHWSELVAFCNILIVIGICNIKTLKIDGEEIKILNSSLVYNADQRTVKVSGDNLNKQRVKTASSSIKFNFVANSGVFSKKMIQMFFGGVDKKQIFSAGIEFADDLKFNDIGYVVSSVVYSANKQVPTLPSLEVIMTIADKRA